MTKHIQEHHNGQPSQSGSDIDRETEVWEGPAPTCLGNGSHPYGEKMDHESDLNEKELKGILEALLFVAHEPLTLEKLTALLGEHPKSAVKEAVKDLQADYDQEGRGLRIAEVAGGFVMVTQPDCRPWIQRLRKPKSNSKLSKSALETLAIISYKQPIIRADIEKIRGVETAGVLRTLLDQKLVRIVGRQDMPGRPILYGTSKQFLQRFGLKDLRDLPPLKEIEELGPPDLPSLPLEDDPSLGNPNQVAVADLLA